MMKRLFILCLLLAVCSGLSAQEQAVQPTTENDFPATFPCEMVSLRAERGDKTYLVANINDESHVYRRHVQRHNVFFVISKQEFRLYVYEAVSRGQCGGDAQRDTLLAATFPICYAINEGPKTIEGDCSTPECSMEHPFLISEIRKASSWKHDFGDGRGSFLAYGPWFMRLDLSKSDCHPNILRNRTIGIHGSTGNERSVPGRDSEGCVRLLDEDLNLLYKLYACRGTKVVIKSAQQDKLPFERTAELLCIGYRRATYGHPLVGK